MDAKPCRPDRAAWRLTIDVQRPLGLQPGDRVNIVGNDGSLIKAWPMTWIDL